MGTNVARARELVNAAGAIWTAGRDATLERTEEIANKRGDRLRDPSQVRTVLAYEESNRNRKGVVEAAKARIEALASSLVAAS